MITLSAEVQAGHEWSESIGEGWRLRLVPITSPPQSGQSYSGWDIVVSPAGDDAYPDAVLLATPPYGSLNQREIGTTFGLRAQDAVAWQPRQFHFLLSAMQLGRARELYRKFTTSPSSASADQKSSAGTELLQLVTAAPSNPQLGSGKLKILQATYSAGTGDPAPYAQQWAMHLGDVPHNIVETGHPASARGELVSMRFSATLWLPGEWKSAPKPSGGVTLGSTTCPE